MKLLYTEYYPKADAFLLPLTGLKKEMRKGKFQLKSYLFWKEYSIEDYKLIISFDYEDEKEMKEFCQKYVFPVLDKRCVMVENYDINGKCIFILDMGEWAMDIQQFLHGKYSKFSREAKKILEDYHTTKERTRSTINIKIYSILYPNMKMDELDGITPLEYVTKFYGLDPEEMKRIGEIGTLYDKAAESMILDIDDIYKYDDKI